jgi:hypothetical protein
LHAGGPGFESLILHPIGQGAVSASLAAPFRFLFVAEYISAGFNNQKGL